MVISIFRKRNICNIPCTLYSGIIFSFLNDKYNFWLPSSQSAPPLPTGHRHRNPGPALLPKHVPPYLQGFVAQTGRSQRVPVNPGGQLQNQDPLSSCWVHTAPFRHGWVVQTADWHSTTSLPDTASWYRWTSSPYNYNIKMIQKHKSTTLYYTL